MDFFTTLTSSTRRQISLQMLKYSAFAPSHVHPTCCAKRPSTWGTGDGLWRLCRLSFRSWLIQKYLNSGFLLLRSVRHRSSSSAHWAYVWGIKGRYDEPQNQETAKLDELNDYNRHLYRDEVAGLIERLNGFRKQGEKELYAPDIKFNRAIGQFAGQKFHAQTGEPLSDKEYDPHFHEVMPTAEDRKLLLEIIANEKKWIVEKEGARDPFQTIGEPRKSAINL